MELVALDDGVPTRLRRELRQSPYHCATELSPEGGPADAGSNAGHSTTRWVSDRRSHATYLGTSAAVGISAPMAPVRLSDFGTTAGSETSTAATVAALSGRLRENRHVLLRPDCRVPAVVVTRWASRRT
jgi:hypothetical protein